MTCPWSQSKSVRVRQHLSPALRTPKHFSPSAHPSGVQGGDPCGKWRPRARESSWWPGRRCRSRKLTHQTSWWEPLGQRGQKVKANLLITVSAVHLFIQQTCIGTYSMPGSTEDKAKPRPCLQSWGASLGEQRSEVAEGGAGHTLSPGRRPGGWEHHACSPP